MVEIEATIATNCNYFYVYKYVFSPLFALCALELSLWEQLHRKWLADQ